MDPSFLTEFNYTFGDPRPILQNFLLEHHKSIESPSFVFHYKCIKYPQTQKLVKEFIQPKHTEVEAFNKLLESQSSLILVPIVITNKLTCTKTKRNYAKHMVYVLYNKLTRECERIDVKKYHITNFFIKAHAKKLKTTFVPQYFGKKAKSLTEIDIPYKFVEKFPQLSEKSLYPIYLVNYLAQRCENPTLTAGKIKLLVLKLGATKIMDTWNKYANLSLEVTKCKDDHVLKAETMNCVKRTSKSLNGLRIAPPTKKCSDGQAFDVIKRKCVPKDKAKDINIILSPVAKKVKSLKFKTKFQHLGAKDITIQAVNFVLQKHGYIGSLCGMIEWKYNFDTEKHKLHVPDDFWDIWQEALQDDSVRFILTLLRLGEKQEGLHANLLIYDKATHEIERFDPLGSNAHKNYKIDLMDKRIKKLLESQMSVYVPADVKYFTPVDFCPKRIFQTREVDEIHFDDTAGSCATWRIWYIDIRMANPDLTRKQVVDLAMQKIEHFGSFQKFIKAYQLYITESL